VIPGVFFEYNKKVVVVVVVVTAVVFVGRRSFNGSGMQ
jgi:hypothetical protein